LISPRMKHVFAFLMMKYVCYAAVIYSKDKLNFFNSNDISTTEIKYNNLASKFFIKLNILQRKSYVCVLALNASI
jgi:hypothetical protein